MIARQEAERASEVGNQAISFNPNILRTPKIQMKMNMSL